MSVISSRSLIIGIDAANIRQGGGVTHLIELLRNLKPENHGVTKVVVWAGFKTLSVIEDRPWLEKINPSSLNGGLLRRSLWQRFCLAEAAKSVECDILFEPGGNCAAAFKPAVTMSQNMLPFEWRELRRYGWSLLTIKLLLLRFLQSRSFRRVEGMIFLTRYAQHGVTKVTGPLDARQVIIPHGLSSRFFIPIKVQREISEYSQDNPLNLIYVSIIDQYKHQSLVVEAVAMLRNEGVPVALHLIGPAYAPALVMLRKAMAHHDPKKLWVHYHGSIPFTELHQHYARADIGIFASSCENLPNILLETMAAGLPVVCSNRGPMPEVLGDSGEYFDPEYPNDLTRVLRKLIKSPQLRTSLAQSSVAIAKRYSWKICADQTFKFLKEIWLNYRR